MGINTEMLQGQWNEVQGKVKEKWGQLTDDDLRIQNGNIDQVIGRIQTKTGEGREAVEKFLTGLTGKGASAVSNAAESYREYAGNAGERIRDGVDRIADSSRESYRRAENVAQDHPTAVVGSAFGLGLLFGVLLGLNLRNR